MNEKQFKLVATTAAGTWLIADVWHQLGTTSPASYWRLSDCIGVTICLLLIFFWGYFLGKDSD